MKLNLRTWVGADPGGAGRFGVAVLKENSLLFTENVDCADDAVNFVCRHLDGPPAGVGVDAPLWWSSGRSGGRKADKWLRDTYELSGGEVQTVNSLRGAAVIQAAMFIVRLREKFPGVSVTETHPKALFKVLRFHSRKHFCEKFNVEHLTRTTDEWDAIISAIAAREGFERRWKRDLSKDRCPSEQDPKSYWLAPVHYFWPEIGTSTRTSKAETALKSFLAGG